MLLFDLLIAATFDARCGLGWEYEETMGQCFWFAPSDYRTWNDAREQCMLGGGDLISIVSAQEQTYINGVNKTMFGSRWWGFEPYIDIYSFILIVKFL